MCAFSSQPLFFHACKWQQTILQHEKLPDRLPQLLMWCDKYGSTDKIMMLTRLLADDSSCNRARYLEKGKPGGEVLLIVHPATVALMPVQQQA